MVIPNSNIISADWNTQANESKYVMFSSGNLSLVTNYFVTTLFQHYELFENPNIYVSSSLFWDFIEIGYRCLKVVQPWIYFSINEYSGSDYHVNTPMNHLKFWVQENLFTFRLQRKYSTWKIRNPLINYRHR